MPNRINIARNENVVIIQVLLEARIIREKPKMYASCFPALDLYSQGETRKEAKANLIEATELFLEGCIEDQTLDQALKDCGFHPVAASPAKKRRAKKAKVPPEFRQAKPLQIPVQVPMAAYG